MELLLVHAAATWFMAGLIWFVQLVHYPLFAGVGPREFLAYSAAHQRRTAWVVGPVMLTEAGTALLLLARPDPGAGLLPWIGAALLAVVWLSTWRVQVPLHSVLASRHDAGVIRGLVRGNWIRTAAWSLRGVLVLWWLAMLTAR